MRRHENPALTSIESLVSLVEVRSLVEVPSVLLSNNPRLASLAGLSKVVSVSDVWIVNLAIADLTGLNALDSVDKLHVSNNPNLTSLAGLDKLTSAWSINITSNEVLKNLRALGKVKLLDGELSITGNTVLPPCEVSWLLSSIGEANIGSINVANNADGGTCP